MFSLQVLGAVAQLERALIAERTKSGLNAARVRGRVGGDPEAPSRRTFLKVGLLPLEVDIVDRSLDLCPSSR
jgi:DNA invertase Pin-like site-specific DNA recombinase